ncbi:MAG: hypothetical protein ABSG64_04810 [Solirubrobacteraceae bacterium]
MPPGDEHDASKADYWGSSGKSATPPAGTTGTPDRAPQQAGDGARNFEIHQARSWSALAVLYTGLAALIVIAVVIAFCHGSLTCLEGRMPATALQTTGEDIMVGRNSPEVRTVDACASSAATSVGGLDASAADIAIAPALFTSPDEQAQQMALDASTALETIATDHGGSYAAANNNLALVHSDGQATRIAPGHGKAYISSVTATIVSYTVTVTSTTGDTFSINRVGGQITRTCTSAGGTSGSCVDGTW